jgi:hypothetical protein
MMIFTLLLSIVYYGLTSQSVLSLFKVCCQIRDFIIFKIIRNH